MLCRGRRVSWCRVSWCRRCVAAPATRQRRWLGLQAMYKEAVLSIPDDFPCQHWNVVTGVGQLVTPLGGTKCVSRCRDCVVCVAVSQDGRDTTSHGIDKMCVVCVADTVSCVVRHSVVCRETVCRVSRQGSGLTPVFIALYRSRAPARRTSTPSIASVHATVLAECDGGPPLFIGHPDRPWDPPFTQQASLVAPRCLCSSSR